MGALLRRKAEVTKHIDDTAPAPPTTTRNEPIPNKDKPKPTSEPKEDSDMENLSTTERLLARKRQRQKEDSE